MSQFPWDDTATERDERGDEPSAVTTIDGNRVRVTTIATLTDDRDMDDTVTVVAEVTPATTTSDAQLVLIEPRGLLPLAAYRCEEAAWLAYEDALVAAELAAQRERERREDVQSLAAIAGGFSR